MAGQPISLDIPAVGTAGTTYASKINTALSTLETELERKVVPADMTINAGLSFLSSGSYYPATDLKYVQLSLQSESALDAASYPMAMFAGSSDGELYFNDNSGRQVQITTNGTVNVSTSGGVTGSGYGSSGVEVRFDSGDGEYEFRTGGGTNDFADLRGDDVILSDGSTNFVTLTAQAMSADYTLTLPAAVPATNNTVISMTTGGTLAATATPTVTSLTTTGTLSVGSTSTFTGKATFVAEIAHPTRRRHITPMECFSETASFNPTADTPMWIASSSGDVLYIPLRMEEGETLIQVEVWTDTSGTAYTREIDIGYWNDVIGSASFPGSSFDETFTAASSGRHKVTINCTDTVVGSPSTGGTSNGIAFLRFDMGNSDKFYGAIVSYSRA